MKCKKLAAGWDGGRVSVVGSADTQTTASERSPEGTRVSSAESVDIGLDPCITSGGDCERAGESVSTSWQPLVDERWDTYELGYKVEGPMRQ